MSRFSVFSALLPLVLASCGPKDRKVETVPSALLDTQSGGAANSSEEPAEVEAEAEAAPEITSKSTGRDDLPHFPPPADALSTESGLKYVYLANGSGKTHPKTSSQVTVHYEGRTTDGQVFDSSIARGEAATFPLDAVIEGWREAVKLMVEGDKIRAWVPEELAYKGVEGAPKGMLVFDIELIAIAAE